MVVVTKHQRDLLSMAASGMKRLQLARQCSVSPSTIKREFSDIADKLENIAHLDDSMSRRKYSLVMLALSLGIIRLEDIKAFDNRLQRFVEWDERTTIDGTLWNGGACSYKGCSHKRVMRYEKD